MVGFGPAEAFLALNLVGFALGSIISILLLALSLRAMRLPGTPLANVGLALCALVWNAGGLMAFLQRPDMFREPGASVALAVQFTGAALWPLPLLTVWGHMAVKPWQCMLCRILRAMAWVHAVAVAGGIWLIVAGWRLPLISLEHLAAYDSAFLLIAGAALLRGRPASRSLLLSTSLVLGGILITIVSVLVSHQNRGNPWINCVLGVTSEQSLLLVVLGMFFLFARFRFSDLLIRYSVRLFLASLFAGALAVTMTVPAVRFFEIGGYAEAGQFIALVMLSTAALLFFPPVDRVVRQFVDSRLFHTPDYAEAARRLGESVRLLRTEPEIGASVESAVAATLALSQVRVIRYEGVAESGWPPLLNSGHIAEVENGSAIGRLIGIPDVELLVPVRTSGVVTLVLAAAPGSGRRALVSHEINYLGSVAAQLGTRLDLLRLEQEMVERESREAVLQRQVTEAELRALRAQINPHFLFNSLNTIASLIATDPPRAEVMTVRLARVFRHVLANSSRQMVTVREEMDFLRAYLDIEEARFGNRLQVEIDMAPDVAMLQVPSLILQPVVENALRHGLGPRQGPGGRLRISAGSQGDNVRLEVEDNGVGATEKFTAGSGVGLRNIVQRLTALYRDHARLNIEAAVPSGTRVTLVFPRSVLQEPV